MSQGRPNWRNQPRSPEPGCTTTPPADLWPRWQKVRQSRATQPRWTHDPGWVTTSAVHATHLFWDSDSFNVKCHGRHLAPSKVHSWRRVGLGRCRGATAQPTARAARRQSDARTNSHGTRRLSPLKDPSVAVQQRLDCQAACMSHVHAASGCKLDSVANDAQPLKARGKCKANCPLASER